MATCTIAGVPHYYEWITAAGDQPTGDRPVLVFIHGWAGSSRYWRTTAHSFKAHYDCLLYDMRGFGRSSIPTAVRQQVLARGYELDTFGADLAELLDALSLPQVALNAHSMGASVAALFINQYPGRVSRAVLTCNGVFEYDAFAFSTFHRFGGYVVRWRPPWLGRVPLAPRFFMARFLSRPIPAAEKRAFLQDFLEADFDTALGTIYTSVSQRATEVMPVAFAQLPIPTLLVSGERDQITPAELGRRAALLNFRIRYALIPNTGHFPMLEAPDLYRHWVENFLLGDDFSPITGHI